LYHNIYIWLISHIRAAGFSSCGLATKRLLVGGLNAHLHKTVFYFIFGEFSQPHDQKKRAGNSNQGIFEILKKNSPYLDQKNLDVASFRQCIPVGR
jgi:hypothetical protein